VLIQVGVINIVSEDFIEAVNFSSMSAPFGVSEFELTGLHPMDSRMVKAPRLKEAVFSVEAKLVETREYKSKVYPDQTATIMAVVEGVRFWAREDAIDEEQSRLDPNVCSTQHSEIWYLFVGISIYLFIFPVLIRYS
jgi:flavin reductase (DIM6/NTAB) family NADH-FMN oxidoreductase RutF